VTPPLPRKTIEEAVEALRVYGSKDVAARALGINRVTFRGRLARAARLGIIPGTAPESNQTAWRETADRDSYVVEFSDSRIRSVDDCYKKAGLDPLCWIVDRVVVNGWDVTMKMTQGGAESPFRSQNQQIKVWFKRLIPDATEAAIKFISKNVPRLLTPPKQRPTKGAEYLLEISLQDHHFGKLAWHPESGDDYDLGIATRVYEDVVHRIVDRVRGVKVARVLYVVGHDLLHSEGATKATTNGTPQETDSRWQKAYVTAFNAVARGIEYVARTVAPVNVVVMPGNHDRATTFYLGHALQQLFAANKRVQVDNAPMTRKYFKWGANLIGICHGAYKDDPREPDLPMLMATEQAKDWAETTHHEWHLGDQHISRGSLSRVYGHEKGVMIRRLPSLCGTGAWDYGKGFLGPQTSEAYLFHAVNGPTEILTFPMPQDAYKNPR
jgi:hypothetical protein